MKITKKAVIDIRTHCRKTPHLESCGYVFGEDSMVQSIMCGRNLDKSPVTYTIDPETTFESVFRKDFKGVYHSHLGEAFPSGIDRAKKKYPNKHYLIYSLSKDTLRSYLWDGKEFHEEEIEVIE